MILSRVPVCVSVYCYRCLVFGVVLLYTYMLAAYVFLVLRCVGFSTPPPPLFGFAL